MAEQVTSLYLSVSELEKDKQIKNSLFKITHEVKSGETFSSIASRYNLKTETLKGLNSSISDVKAGTTRLKVQVKAVHTVGPGDVLRVVAEKYGVTKSALMKANGKTRDFSERGEKLIIPFPEKK